MALATKLIYADPTAGAFSLGVTGTNGKTTTTFLAQALLTQAGFRVARMGTIETQFENFSSPSELTTPDFYEIQKSFAELKRKGASAFVFEASSHALDQRRLLGLELNAAIFTNLTPEHLDYHQTMERYYDAKKRLFFDLLRGSKKAPLIAIVPQDGSFGSRLADELKSNSEIQTIRWAQRSRQDSDTRLVVESWKSDLTGCSLRILDKRSTKTFDLRSHLVGEYNVSNLMGMVALGVALELTPVEIQAAADRVGFIPGRLERVGHSVFVDYAHTPDALENVLATLRPLTRGKLKVVFGCGGDRDKTKRSKMGAIAELYADEIFVTSDNPRTEDPDVIIEDILKGLQRLKPTHINADRKLSIELCLKKLDRDDVVLIAGKGHENYQILGTKKIHFDDREIARSVLDI